MVRREEMLQKLGTALGVIDSGFLPLKKSQILEVITNRKIHNTMEVRPTNS